MTNSQSNNTQNKDYIANLGQGINSGIIGITTFVERYQTMLANNIKPSAEEYQKIGKYLYNSALDGLQSAKNLVENLVCQMPTRRQKELLKIFWLLKRE